MARWMLAILAACCLNLGLQGPAAAMFLFQPPPPVFDVPVERLIANLNKDPNIDRAERVRLTARLHLLAFVQNSSTLPVTPGGERVVEAGDRPCAEKSAYRYDKEGNLIGSMYAPVHPDTPLPPGGMDFDGFVAKGSADLKAPVRAGRCAETVYSLEPRPAVPIYTNTPPDTPSLAARTHLRKARDLLKRAVKTDPDDTRSRLALAWALDRLGDTAGARRTLMALLARFDAAYAKADIMEDQKYLGDNWFVLREAIEHLKTMAVSDPDKALLLKFETLFGKTTAGPQPITPILVPLLPNIPFEDLIIETAAPQFDFSGTGDKSQTGWISNRAAWLVWDPNNRKTITSGFDLIGARSFLAFWQDGFQALNSLDDNHDGTLSGAELDGLALWADKNGDALSTPDEVTSLAAHGIVGLATSGTAHAPDLIIAKTGVHMADGTHRPLYDWTPPSVATKPGK